MKRKNQLSFLFPVALALAVAMPSIGIVAQENPVNLTILATSDMHANLTDFDYYTQKNASMGMARVSSIVNQERKAHDNVLLLDNGDTIQGTPFAQYYLENQHNIKNPMIQSMNFMQYDAMALGNHEFNYGIALLDNIKQDARFPMISANTYYPDGTNYTTPYIIKEVDGVRVAILGLTTPGVSIWDKANVEGKLVFADPVVEGVKWVSKIKQTEKPDAIIVLMHSGLTASPENYYDGQVMTLANFCPDITAIIAGHSHTQVDLQLDNGVSIVQPKKWGEKVAAIDLTFEKRGDNYVVADKQTRIVESKFYQNNQNFLDFTTMYTNAVDQSVNNLIGYATDDFSGENQQLENTALMDLIHNVQLQYGNADISLAASFNQNSNIPKGDIKESSINSLYVYENYLFVTEMTGKQIKEYLEYCATYFEQSLPGDREININKKMPGYNYDMIKGLDYTLDITKPVGARLSKINYKGKPLKDDEVLKVALNNYRFGGGGGHFKKIGLTNPKVLFDSQASLGDAGQIRTLIKEYIKQEQSISPIHDDNYHLVSAVK